MSRWIIALAVLTALTLAFAGCIGADEEATATQTETEANQGEQNPWKDGLDEAYPTPEIAVQRSAEERRANLAEPGDPEFAAFDAAVMAWMEKHDIPTGQIALMHDGELRYTRGYGVVDREASQSANTSTMFRIASVTKPMTAALVSLQVEQGLYNWTDPVFCVPPDPAPNCRLPIDPHPEKPVEDERLEDVQVDHLLAHVGGWDRSSDWMLWGSGPIEISQTLDIESPPSAWRTAQFMMGEPLDHEPGGTNPDGYCNKCYVLAGLVAEAATGADLGVLYDAYLFEPLEIDGDIEPGYTLPEQRNPREPFYPCEAGETRNIFDPSEEVCWADGGWSMQTILGAGGVISTGEAVAAVYEAYSPDVPGGDIGPMTWRGHTGGLPGTATMAEIVESEDEPLGKTQFVGLFNSRNAGQHCYTMSFIFQLTPYPNCSVYDLHTSMYPLMTAWGPTQSLGPGDGLAG